MATFLEPHYTPVFCRYCGDSKELTYNSLAKDDYCASCGGWQQEEYPIINYGDHRWYILFVDDKGYSHLARKSWLGELKRKGYVSTTIEIRF